MPVTEFSVLRRIDSMPARADCAAMALPPLANAELLAAIAMEFLRNARLFIVGILLLSMSAGFYAGFHELVRLSATCRYLEWVSA